MRRIAADVRVPLAFTAAVLAAALLAGCGGGGSPSKLRSRTTTVHVSYPAPVVSAPRSCIKTAGFGGLGASANDFDANNDDSTGPAGPTPGAALYEVIATKGGCVAAFAVQDSASPPLKATDMVGMVSRGFLPKDARQVAASSSCAVWRSPSLRRAIGWLYAKAAGAPQTGTGPGSGLIEATSDTTC
jgi:hypothetical protein